jgi:hypothetical protein
MKITCCLISLSGSKHKASGLRRVDGVLIILSQIENLIFFKALLLAKFEYG